MITTSQSIIALSAALLKFQSEATGVYRDGKNPHFKSKYATLENVIDTARPILQSAGLVFIQGLGAVNDNTVEVTTRLIHAESGEWMESTLQMPLGKAKKDKKRYSHLERELLRTTAVIVAIERGIPYRNGSLDWGR